MKKTYLILILFVLFLSGNRIYPQWVLQNSGTTQILKSVCAVNLQTAFVSGGGGMILKTINGGDNWSILNSGTSQSLNSVYFFDNSTGLACGDNGTIIRTANGGINWSVVSITVSSAFYSVSFSNQNNGIISGSSGTLLYTSNGGLNWTVAVEGFITSLYSCNMINASVGYAAGVNTIFQPLIAKTTNGGANWNYYVFYLNSNEGNLRGVKFLDANEGFAVSNVWNGQGGISHSANGGANWTTQLFSNSLNCIDFPSGSTGYTAGYSGVILKSTDGGLNWTSQSSGTGGILRSIDFTDSVTGYAVGDNGIILKTTNGGITAVSGNQNNIPDKFELFQNYPNPFNPVTSIKFSLPIASQVTFNFFDVLGNEIKNKQTSERFNAGVHDIHVDFSDFSSGIYFYQLNAGEYRMTKKMILIK